MRCYLGIDFGTSGARAIAIDDQCNRLQTITCELSQQTPTVWQEALDFLLSHIEQEIRSNLQAIAINGTSGTVLLCDSSGHPLVDPLLYADNRGQTTLAEMESFVPSGHLVYSATSGLAKLLWWRSQGLTAKATYFLHQADWLSFVLHGQLGCTDYHNALKTGYDVSLLDYPAWLKPQQFFPLLPQQVKVPGEKIGKILPQLAHRYALNSGCYICAGTTDSIAAFIASGASRAGEAVTSLGSTLVIKLLSHKPVNALEYGIYSHRFGDLWLTGGASNSGGAVLRAFFDETQLVALSQRIDLQRSLELDYYPLLKAGERFPINDPYLEPRLTPRPESDWQFLQGLLAGITQIEVLGYQKLQALGASSVQRIYTAGGGAKNPIWMTMRQQALSCPVLRSPQPEAAYGSALLAKRGLDCEVP